MPTGRPTAADRCRAHVNLRYPTSAKYLLSVSSRVPIRAISRWKPETIGAHEGLLFPVGRLSARPQPRGPEPDPITMMNGLSSVTTLPDGAWPVMLLPLNDDLSINGEALDQYTDWLIDQGAAGLFPVALSGEMYDLEERERLDVAARVVERSAGRVPVIASVVEFGSPAEVAAGGQPTCRDRSGCRRAHRLRLLADGEDESVLRDKIEAALTANPGVDFGIYECPLPYHRILSTETVQWIAETGRFVFFKETSHDVDLMADRVRVSAGTPMKVYNAGIETLVESLRVGVSGLSGWVVNVYPETSRGSRKRA